MKTAQEIFDKVVSHLRKQKVRCAVGESKCKYRLGDMRCAAGVLIPDDKYHSSMEGYPIFSILSTQDKEPWTKELLPHLVLIQKLQHIHDIVNECDWESELKDMAIPYSIKYTEPVPA